MQLDLNFKASHRALLLPRPPGLSPASLLLVGPGSAGGLAGWREVVGCLGLGFHWGPVGAGGHLSSDSLMDLSEAPPPFWVDP